MNKKMDMHPRWQASGFLRLDSVDSKGNPGRPISTSRERLMALSISPHFLWYGFIIAEPTGKIISPGEEVLVIIEFLDDQGARDSFALHSSILFGDGTCSRGTLIFGSS